MAESRTIAGDVFSGRLKRLVRGLVEIVQPSRLIRTLGWYVGRFKILTGIATLSVASAILAISGRGRNDNRNSEMSLRLVPLVLAAFSLLFFSERRERAATERPPSRS